MSDTVKKPNRWLLPLLFISLALNLLIVGIVVGWMASHGGDRRGEYGAVRGLVGEPFLRALPDDHRQAMLRDVMREAPRIRESRDSLRARFQAFLAALRADPYDPSAVAALLQQQRQVALQRQDIGERFLLQRIEAMTPQEREDYASALERSFRRLTRRDD